LFCTAQAAYCLCLDDVLLFFFLPRLSPASSLCPPYSLAVPLDRRSLGFFAPPVAVIVRRLVSGCARCTPDWCAGSVSEREIVSSSISLPFNSALQLCFRNCSARSYLPRTLRDFGIELAFLPISLFSSKPPLRLDCGARSRATAWLHSCAQLVICSCLSLSLHEFVFSFFLSCRL